MKATTTRRTGLHTRYLTALAAGLTLTVSGWGATAGPASATPTECTSPQSGSPILVTADCIDPTYANAVIDEQKDVTTPVALHRVSGHFDGTAVKFTIYLPAAKDWKGRFFQYTYPTSIELATDDQVAFGAASGAYTVQASGTGGYRHDAAAAKFAKTVASEYYGSGTARIYGYIYGPSGGSFQTVGAIENTIGVWDGAVPIVEGVPTSIPINFFLRAQARMILKDVAAKIQDAVLPGGSGNPYSGLTRAQQQMLREVTRLGVPLKAWQDPDYVLGLSTSDGLLGFGSLVKALDPTYVTDFWTKDGYLGTEKSALGDLVRAELANLGDTEANRWQVALPSYYRHQVPPVSEGYTVFDALRDSSGNPLYPQRAMLIGPMISKSVTGGGTFPGAVNGKVIMVDNLVDTDAYPWHADWYAKRVRSALGEKAFANTFRLYYNDNADHLEGPVTGAKASRIVSYDPIVQQALRDVSAWAEQGSTPPASTRYRLNDGQIEVPSLASMRRGIQPVVTLRVRGGDRVQVRVGQEVSFLAHAEVPDHAGRIVTSGWDFDGSGDFTTTTIRHPRTALLDVATHRFTKPGTYYVSFRVATSRSGELQDFAQVQNLDRVRVVVR